MSEPDINLPTPSGAPRKFMRGARRSPAHKLLSAIPYRAFKAPPAQFAVVPSKLDMWGNDQYGDCVSAEEAFAKAAWSVQCGLPETFIATADVIAWASKHGFLNGADLASVMDAMATDGMPANGQTYTDGPYFGVDYSQEAVLQSALTQGPVKIAIDANALPSGAGNNMGWYATGGGNFPNTDHCVALCGYGPAGWLFQQMGVPLPSGLSATQAGYLLYTWDTIGFVDHAWLMGTTTEAWVRTPTTVGQSPSPSPTPPPGPTPAPPPTPGAGVQIVLPSGQTVTIPDGTYGSGVPMPATAHVYLPQAMGPGTFTLASVPGQAQALPNPLIVIMDVLAALSAVQSGNPVLIIAAVNKLLADFNLPPLPIPH